MNNLGVIGPLSTTEHDVCRSRTAEEQAGVEAAQIRAVRRAFENGTAIPAAALVVGYQGRRA